MVWSLSLAVAVVCVSGMCSCVEADLMSRLIMPRDYGVKLCGREFIRAVIYTCGGSRWRRSADGDQDSLWWSSLSDVTADDALHSWQSGTTEPRSPAQLLPPHSLAELLALNGGEGWQQQQQQQQQQSPERSLPDPVLGELQRGRPEAAAAVALDDVWPNKKKRNFSLGVAGMCCSQGCTKNDIGRLC